MINGDTILITGAWTRIEVSGALTKAGEALLFASRDADQGQVAHSLGLDVM
ncbi:MAG: hypothetical protein H7288_08030 [Kineosporiaceae bacterium]|nr:hypothetical protein [Aeromicrobium sp.]